MRRLDSRQSENSSHDFDQEHERVERELRQRIDNLISSIALRLQRLDDTPESPETRSELFKENLELRKVFAFIAKNISYFPSLFVVADENSHNPESYEQNVLVKMLSMLRPKREGEEKEDEEKVRKVLNEDMQQLAADTLKRYGMDFYQLGMLPMDEDEPEDKRVSAPLKEQVDGVIEALTEGRDPIFFGFRLDLLEEQHYSALVLFQALSEEFEEVNSRLEE